MDLLFSDSSFSIHGVSYEGFPILLDEEMNIVEPVHSFLIYQCIKRGRVQSKRSWVKFGKDIYDYFSYLEANKLVWNSIPTVGVPTPIVTYRDWSNIECKLSPKTINDRLNTIISFYKWAEKEKRINQLPYDLENRNVKTGSNFLQHINSKRKTIQSPNILLTRTKEPVKFLNLEQVKDVLRTVRNPVHKLIVRMLLQTGLRNEELRSFPSKYITNPNEIKTNKVIVECKNTEMRLKNNKSRTIHIPALLMELLWDYQIFDRPSLVKVTDTPQKILFLTKYGTPFTENTIVDLFRKISKKVGFRVTAHMLRHTYATYTLHALRDRGFKGDALLYLRERLGHSSIETTMIYLHLLDEIDGDLITKYDKEIDGMYEACS